MRDKPGGDGVPDESAKVGGNEVHLVPQVHGQLLRYQEFQKTVQNHMNSFNQYSGSGSIREDPDPLHDLLKGYGSE